VLPEFKREQKIAEASVDVPQFFIESSPAKQAEAPPSNFDFQMALQLEE